MDQKLVKKSRETIKDSILSLEKNDHTIIPKQLAGLVIAGILLLILSLFAKFTSITSIENKVFYFAYYSPNQVGYFVSGIMQFGAVLFVFVAAAIAFIYNRIKLSRDFVIAGILAWFFAKLIKELVSRPRPVVALSDVIARSEDLNGLGYPSGHMAGVSALGFILWPYLNKIGKVAVLIIICLVGIGRMYVGAHYPLDLIGGVLIGWICASFVYLIFRYEKVTKRNVLEKAANIVPEMIHTKKDLLRKILLGLFLIFAIIVFIPFLNKLPEVVRAIQTMNLIWVIPIILCSACTYVFAAMAQIGSISHKQNFFEVLMVQVGGSFANRIVPGGLGGVGVNVKYLQNKGIRNTAAATSIAVKSAFAFIFTAVFVFTALLASGESIMELIKIDKRVSAMISVIVLVILACCLMIKKLRVTIKKKVLESWKEVKKLANSRKYIALITGTIGTTLFYTLAFYLTLLAFSINLNIFNAFIVYILGTSIGNIFPTPGGIGGTEAALAGGLVFFGVELDIALAAILIYRIATFWLPAFIGAPIFFYLRKKELI